MVKHDKHGNPSSTADGGYHDGFREQEAWDKERDRQRDEGFPEADDGMPRSPGLGKEVKIGLGVVAALLLALGTVVALKLFGPSGETTAAADGTGDADEKASGKESAFPGSSSKDSQPVVVPARAGTGSPGSKNPRGKTLDDADWSVADDSAGGKDGRSAKSSTSSFMPLRTDRSGADRPTGRHSDNPFGARETEERPGGLGNSLVRPAAPRGIEPGTSPGQRSSDLFAPLAATDDRRGAAFSTGTGNAALSRQTQPQLAAPPAAGGSSMTFRNPPARPSDVAGSAGLESRGIDPGGGIGSIPRVGGPASSPDLTRQPFGSPRIRPDAARSPDGTYEVLPNESFYSIAERLYGTPAYYQALTEHNRRQYPNGRLKPGDVILAPSPEELAKTYPALCPRPDRREEIERRNTLVSSPGRVRGGRVYVVQEGDTLYDIARYELGKARRWAEIYELNRDVIGKQFDYLTPGMQLVLPDSGSSLGPVTQRPGSGLNR